MAAEPAALTLGTVSVAGSPAGAQQPRISPVKLPKNKVDAVDAVDGHILDGHCQTVRLANELRPADDRTGVRFARR